MTSSSIAPDVYLDISFNTDLHMFIHTVPFYSQPVTLTFSILDKLVGYLTGKEISTSNKRPVIVRRGELDKLSSRGAHASLKETYLIKTINSLNSLIRQ